MPCEICAPVTNEHKFVHPHPLPLLARSCRHIDAHVNLLFDAPRHQSITVDYSTLGRLRRAIAKRHGEMRLLEERDSVPEEKTVFTSDER